MSELKAGDRSPPFSLEGIGETISQSDFPRYVLYFYPKDNTAGCTKQAISFNSRYEIFKQMGYEIIGISKDSVLSHQKFAEKYSLKFHLLSDPESETAEKYNVRKEKNMYGKKVMGIVRSAFIIENEIVKHALYNIKAENSAEEVLKVIAGGQV